MVLDLDGGGVRERKRRVGQRLGGFGGDPLADVVDVHPVADLEDVRPVRVPPVEPGAADRGAISEQDPVHRSRVGGAFVVPFADHVDPLFEGERLVGGPRHPRQQVVDAVDHGLTECWRVGHRPRSDHEPAGTHRDHLRKWVGHACRR